MKLFPVVVRMDLEENVFISPGVELWIKDEPVKVLRIMSIERCDHVVIVIFEAVRKQKYSRTHYQRTCKTRKRGF